MFDSAFELLLSIMYSFSFALCSRDDCRDDILVRRNRVSLVGVNLFRLIFLCMLCAGKVAELGQGSVFDLKSSASRTHVHFADSLDARALCTVAQGLRKAMPEQIAGFCFKSSPNH